MNEKLAVVKRWLLQQLQMIMIYKTNFVKFIETIRILLLETIRKFMRLKVHFSDLSAQLTVL